MTFIFHAMISVAIVVELIINDTPKVGTQQL